MVTWVLFPGSEGGDGIECNRGNMTVINAEEICT